jgi:hypothetical protein
MESDNWTRCYYAIQRLYRNRVTAFFRERLGQAFPGEWQAKLRAPFKKEWERIVTNAQATRATGELATPIKDDADYLSVGHFYNIFETYFDVLFPALPVVTSEERGQVKSAILRWSKTVKDLRDPLSHPPENDLSPLDALAMLDAARRLISHIDRTVADKIQEVESELLRGGLATVTEKLPLDDSLPPAESIVVRFVERGCVEGSLGLVYEPDFSPMGASWRRW